MAEQGKLVVVAGRKAGMNVIGMMAAAGELREATTGQIVVMPRVMAVAAPQPARSFGATGLVSSAEVQGAGVRQSQGTEAGEEVGFYRKYTEALLRRYVQMTMEAGRVSSMMGREVLGGRASSYRIHGFDDAVIFRLDVEKCLRQLQLKEQEVIQRIAIQEYTHAEAADLLGVSLRTIGTRYSRALDKLTAILLRVKLLEPLKGLHVRVR